MREDGDPSSSESRPRVRTRRARIACYQCKSRRTRCDAASSGACSSCVSNNLRCERPPEGSRKKRGRKPCAQKDASAINLGTSGPSSISNHIWRPSYDASVLDNLSTPSLDPIFAEAGAIPGGTSHIDRSNSMRVQPSIDNLLAPFDVMLNTGMSSESSQGDVPWMLGLQDFQDQLRPLDPVQLQTQVQALSAPVPGQTSGSPFDWAALLGPSEHLRNRGPNSSASDMQPTLPSDLAGFQSQDGEAHEREDERDSLVATAWCTRPHGPSAIRPGYEQSTLRIRLSPSPLIAASPIPDEAVLMGHLVDIFMDQFGCQFPVLNRNRSRDLLQQCSQAHSSFLLYAIAAVSARFSSDPRIALPGLRPYQYGDVFKTRAMPLVGMMMAIPSYETVLAFLFLALSGLGGGSSTETWMLIGLAVRMCQDMGLHLQPNGYSHKFDSVLRAERLTFWSVVITDYALCLMEGRTTSIPAHTITQDLPSEDDCSHTSETKTSSEELPRHPFPFVAQTMLTVGPLIDSLNSGGDDNLGFDGRREQALSDVCSRVAADYDELHIDVTWNAANLQLHYKAGRGPIYLFLHIFSHAIQCLRQNVGLQEEFVDFAMSGKGAQEVSAGLRSNRWLHSPRFIGDMLVLANLIDLKIYLAMPLISQCFFLAGKGFALDKRFRHRLSSENSSSISPRESGEKYKSEVFKILTNHNIGYFRQALASMAKYWTGVSGMRDALQRCLDNEDEGEDEDAGHLASARGAQSRHTIAETSATISLEWLTASDLPVDVFTHQASGTSLSFP
ncbi:fungal-specific transcription factor domain-domain-containing protein [Naematelia encephala]|uniref:Fungal-specific transcription factor domain-domain-containing protein n=1 Tax=Naematelia encephala TaxID=71784 RepID=A0A1Y2AW00_9TREE|nr:fungal-specific transcription factor domain-domain-containing protein [Naematelia encephala]